MLPQLPNIVPAKRSTNVRRGAVQPSLPAPHTGYEAAVAGHLIPSPAGHPIPYPWMLAFAGVLLFVFPISAHARRVASPAGQKKSAASTHTAPIHPGPATAGHVTSKVSASIPAIQTAPPAPLPPILQAARPATVKFSQGKLRIDANNSSLDAILEQISRETGLAVEGLKHDKRIYGQYGPGSVSSTLSQLLDGAGYNYVIVDGAPGHPPTRLLLTLGEGPTGSSSGNPSALPRSATAANPAPSSEPENPSAPVEQKTVQQIFDELRRLHPPK